MNVINFGIYDHYGELLHSAVTAVSATAFECIKLNLTQYLEEDIEELKIHADTDWAISDIQDNEALLVTIKNAMTLEDFETNGLVHYEVWEVSGVFDA